MAALFHHETNNAQLSILSQVLMLCSADNKAKLLIDKDFEARRP